MVVLCASAETMALENCVMFMTNRSRLLWRFLVAAVLYGTFFANVCLGQSFLFVSPNTRDHLSEQAAADSLTSFEQTNFLAVARYLGRKLCPAPRISSTEGIFDSDAENSSLITGCAPDKARYLGELLGRYAHQKWVLIFDPSSDSSQNERLLILDFIRDDPADAVKLVRQFTLHGATMVFQGEVVHLYIWVTDHSQDTVVQDLAKAAHGSLHEIPGKGTLIGNDDRIAAQRVFDEKIGEYERAHHLRFSRLLWSKQLHDMTDNTSEMPR